jgi:hypothetical protein
MHRQHGCANTCVDVPSTQGHTRTAAATDSARHARHVHITWAQPQGALRLTSHAASCTLQALNGVDSSLQAHQAAHHPQSIHEGAHTPHPTPHPSLPGSKQACGSSLLLQRTLSRCHTIHTVHAAVPACSSSRAHGHSGLLLMLMLLPATLCCTARSRHQPPPSLTLPPYLPPSFPCRQR